MTIEKFEFNHLIIGLAKALPKWAPDFKDGGTLGIWHAKLSHYSSRDLKGYFATLISTANEFPSLAKMLNDMRTQSTLTHADSAEEVAALIESAIRKYGAPNWDMAQPYLGEIGCAVIEKTGGWEQTCNIQEKDLTSMRRQWRELARITSLKAAEGTLDQAPRLPKGNEPSNLIKQLAAATDITKR